MVVSGSSMLPFYCNEFIYFHKEACLFIDILLNGYCKTGGIKANVYNILLKCFIKCWLGLK